MSTPEQNAAAATCANISRQVANDRGTALMLASLPVLSFIAQYLLSVRAGTQNALFHHLTVMILDWVFVPFNFFVVRVINWNRGARLFVIFCVSLFLNAATHAYWQYNGLDLGHMITKTEVMLPAGWVHLVFSTIETSVLVAFVFCRAQEQRDVRTTTVFAVIYFITMGICGAIMHRGLIASDAVVFTSGLFFVLIYPHLVRSSQD